MTHTRGRVTFPLAAVAAVCMMAATPCGAVAGQGPQGPAQPGPGKGAVVVEQVENGPLFGAEFKWTEINHQNAYLLGGYAGAIFDNTFFIGGAAYWQVDSYFNDYYGYHDYHDYYDDYYDDGNAHPVNAYGGLLLEWYALRAPAASLSLRGLVGGGVANVGWDAYAYGDPGAGHGQGHPPEYGYYAYDQSYFVFEPQLNVSLRVARGVAVVGGVGYRVIAWANGFEDQLKGLTGTVAVRFGGR